MTAPSSILAWKIPCTTEPGRLLSMGSQRVRHDSATSLSLSSYNYPAWLNWLSLFIHSFFFVLFPFLLWKLHFYFYLLLFNQKIKFFLRFNSNVNPLNMRNLASFISEPTFTKLCNLIFFLCYLRYSEDNFYLKSEGNFPSIWIASFSISFSKVLQMPNNQSWFIFVISLSLLECIFNKYKIPHILNMLQLLFHLLTWNKQSVRYLSSKYEFIQDQ